VPRAAAREAWDEAERRLRELLKEAGDRARTWSTRWPSSAASSPAAAIRALGSELLEVAVRAQYRYLSSRHDALEAAAGLGLLDPPRETR
jgi:hypothetical protein